MGNDECTAVGARRAPGCEKGDFCLMATITLTTDPPVDPQTPTLTHYQQLSAEIQAAVDTITTLLPKLEESLIDDVRQARRNLNVPDAFCYTAVNAVEQLPELNAANKLNGA